MNPDLSAPVDTAEQLALLRLRRLPRVGGARCAALLHNFGSRAALEGMRGDGAPVDAAGADWAAEQLARCVELGAQFTLSRHTLSGVAATDPRPRCICS